MELSRKYRWYKIELLDKDRKPSIFIFRGMTADEIRIAGTKKDGSSAEDYVLESCVLDVGPVGEMLGGSSRTLLENIYKVSGLTEEASPIAEALEWIQSDEGTAEALAVSMIAGLTVEILRTCDPHDRAKYLILGKFMFESIYGVEAKDASFSGNKGTQKEFIPPSRQVTKDGKKVIDIPGSEVERFHWQKK